MKLFKFIITLDAPVFQEREGLDPFVWEGLMACVLAESREQAMALAIAEAAKNGDSHEWLRFAEVYELELTVPGVVAWASC